MLAALFVGCQQDQNRNSWQGSDAGTLPDVQTPPSDEGAAVLPDAPADNAVCNDHRWCWIHPAPFPAAIDDLQRVGDRVYAVATQPSDPEASQTPVVLDENLQVETLEVPGDSDLVDLTTTQSGWLALKGDGSVQPFTTERYRDPISIPGRYHNRISGAASDEFLVQSNDSVVVYRQGDVTIHDYESSITDPWPKMAPNGRIWALGEAPEAWLSFAKKPRMTVVEALGPPPGSSCNDDRPWIGENDGTYRWDPDTQTWGGLTPTEFEFLGFACDATNKPLGLDLRGGVNRFIGENWERSDISTQALFDAEPVDGKTFIGGDYGAFLMWNGRESVSAASGFRMRFGPDYLNAPAYRDLWIHPDGTDAALMHVSGIYHGTENEGWTSPDYARSDSVVTLYRAREIWGADTPRFLATRSSFLEWTGTEWVELDDQDDSVPHDARDIAGNGADNVWTVGYSNIHHFDGNRWYHVSFIGSNVHQRIVEEDLVFHSAFVAPNGTPLLAANNGIYEVTGNRELWLLERVADVPCSKPSVLYRKSGGDLVVAGAEGCIARQTQEGWEAFASSVEFGPETQPHAIAAQPGDRPLLVAHDEGLFELREDGTLARQFDGPVRDLEYVPGRNAMLLIQDRGVAAKYY